MSYRYLLLAIILFIPASVTADAGTEFVEEKFREASAQQIPAAPKEETRRAYAKLKPQWSFQANGEVYSIAFSPDGKTLAAGSGRLDQSKVVGHTAFGGTVSYFPGEIQLLDVAAGKEKLILRSNPPRNGLRFSPDGKTFVSCGGVSTLKPGQSFWDEQQTGIVKIWDSTTGKVVLKLEQKRIVTDAAFSPDGRVLATVSFDAKVRLWNLATTKCVAVLEGHRTIIECVAFSRDGRTLASGGYDEIVRLWDSAAKKGIADLSGENAVGPAKGVFALAFSPECKLLAAGVDAGVKVWDLTSRRLLYSLEGGRCASLAFSPNGTLLARATNDGVLHLNEAASGNEKSQWQGHIGGNCAVAFSPDGATLASSGADKMVKFWRLTSQKE